MKKTRILDQYGHPMRGEKYDALGYRAADNARAWGMGGYDGSGDWHARYDRQTLVSASRESHRDNAIYASVVGRMADNILGPTGFSLQARVAHNKKNKQARKEAERLNDLIENVLWPEFAEDPEVRGLYDFNELSRVVLEDMFIAGDVGAIQLNTGQIQLVESEQINSSQTKLFNRRIEQGVELNAVGRPIAYYICPTSDFTCAKGRRIKAENFVYVHGAARRISMTRPVPPFTPTFPNIHRLDDILTAEAVAWQMLSRFAVAINREDADLEAYSLSEDQEGSSAFRDYYFDTEGATLTDRVVQTEMGTMFWGVPGEKLEGIKRDLPGANFEKSVSAYLRLIGMQVGLPLEVLSLNYAGLNFSSARAAMEQAKVSLSRWQRVLARQFHQPIYRRKVREWVERGLLPDRPGIDHHEWIPHPFPWLDVERETKATGTLMDRGIVNYSEVLKGRNRDLKHENDEREHIIERAIERSKDLEKTLGITVPWEYFAGYLPGKTAMAVREGQNGGEETPTDQTAGEEVEDNDTE